MVTVHDLMSPVARAEAIAQVAGDFRKDDETEFSAHGKTVLQVLEENIASSFFVHEVKDEEGRTVAIFGVSDKTLIGPDIGVPWIVASNRLRKEHAVDVARKTRRFVLGMLAFYDRLENFVSLENTLSQKWLRFAGFRFPEPPVLVRSAGIDYLYYYLDRT